MRTIINKILGLAILASLSIGCSQSKSLQKFIVDEQESNTVISFDLPASLLKIDKEMQSPENLETLKTIKKANVLVFKIDDTNKKMYQAKKQELKALLKQDKYTELMRFGNAKKGARIQLLGDADRINELIVFANDDAKGWLLVRILGNDMQPDKILNLLQNSDLDADNANLSFLKDLIQ